MRPEVFSSARTSTVPRSTDGVVPFIGRRSVLRAAVARLEASRGTVLTGPAGIGKTRTLHALIDEATRSSRRVTQVVASRSSATVPFGAFLALLPMELMELAAQKDGLDRALLVRAGVLGLGLDVIGVDDAHLLDHESAALLLDLARTGTTVLFTLDPLGAMPDALSALPDSVRAETIELTPFTPAESAELAEAVLQGVVDAGSALALHEVSGGVPLILRELVEWALRSGTMERLEGLWALVDGPLAVDPMHAHVRAQLELLDEGTRAWIDLVAIADRLPTDLGDALADEAAADRAEAEGWVRLDTETRSYRLSQPVLAQPMTEHLGARVRRRLLQTVVDGVSALDRPLDVEEQVMLGLWRLDLGTTLTTEEALELALSTSPEEPAIAERFLRAASATGDAYALTVLAQHLMASGGLPEAERLLQRAAAAGGVEVRVAALTALAVGVGDRRSAVALRGLEAALVDHPDDPDLRAVQVALYVAESRSAEAVALAAGLSELPEHSAGTVLGEVYGAIALADRGDREAATRMADGLQPMAEQNVRGLPEGPMLHAWLGAAVPWAASRDSRVAIEIAQRGYDRSLRGGLRPDRARFAHLLAAGRLAQGEAAAAVRLLREAEAAPCFWRDSRRPEIVAELVEALVLGGEQGEAERTFERLESIRRTPEQDADHALARAALMMGRGELEAAAGIALEVGDLAASRGEQATAADAWTAALRYGSDDAARRLLAQGDTPSGAVRDLVRAHAAAAIRHDADALMDVAEAYWRLDVRLYAAEVAATAARRYLALGDTVGATSATTHLLRWSVAMPGLVDPLAEPVPLAGLTAREREIVQLAATGLTDRDIALELGISVRTSQTHLGRAFGKLGIHRRHEIIRVLPTR